MGKISILYCCFLNYSGYGQASYNYILSLYRTGIYDVRIRVFGAGPTKNDFSLENYKLFNELKNKATGEEDIAIYQCIPSMQKRVKFKRKTVGFAVFETYNPESSWISCLNKNDAIVVPSQFNYKIFAHEKIKKPLYYIPHCFDVDKYNKDVESIKRYDKFTFLFIGTWKIRKGYNVLIEAFLKEFNNDNVQLLIKTDKINKAKEYVNKIRSKLKIKKGSDNIIFENKVYKEQEMPGFLKSVDCLVLPTMGDGFNLPGMQCMALGVPVLITDFSGPLDYASEETCTFLNKSGFVLYKNMDNIPQFRNKKWAFISTKEVREKMRFVYNNYNNEIIKEKIENGYNFVRKKFNYEEIGTKFKEMIGEVCQK